MVRPTCFLALLLLTGPCLVSAIAQIDPPPPDQPAGKRKRPLKDPEEPLPPIEWDDPEECPLSYHFAGRRCTDQVNQPRKFFQVCERTDKGGRQNDQIREGMCPEPLLCWQTAIGPKKKHMTHIKCIDERKWKSMARTLARRHQLADERKAAKEKGLPMPEPAPEDVRMPPTVDDPGATLNRLIATTDFQQVNVADMEAGPSGTAGIIDVSTELTLGRDMEAASVSAVIELRQPDPPQSSTGFDLFTWQRPPTRVPPANHDFTISLTPSSADDRGKAPMVLCESTSAELNACDPTESAEVWEGDHLSLSLQIPEALRAQALVKITIAEMMPPGKGP